MKLKIILICLFLPILGFAQNLKHQTYIGFKITPIINKATVEDSNNLKLKILAGAGCFAEFNFGYIYNNNFGIASGLGVGIFSSRIAVDMPANYHPRITSSFLNKYTFWHNSIYLPINIFYSIPLTQNLKLVPFIGIDFSSTLGISGRTSMGTEELEGHYLEMYFNYIIIPKVSYTAGISFEQKLKKDKYLKIALVFNASISKSIDVPYQFFPDDEDYTTTGRLYNNRNYIGLNIAYRINNFVYEK